MINVRPTKRLGTIPSSKRDVRFLGEPQRRQRPRVGHRHDVIGFDRALPGQFPPHRLANHVNALAENFAGRVGKINVLENAVGAS